MMKLILTLPCHFKEGNKITESAEQVRILGLLSLVVKLIENGSTNGRY